MAGSGLRIFRLQEFGVNTASACASLSCGRTHNISSRAAAESGCGGDAAAVFSVLVCRGEFSWQMQPLQRVFAVCSVLAVLVYLGEFGGECGHCCDPCGVSALAVLVSLGEFGGRMGPLLQPMHASRTGRVPRRTVNRKQMC